MTATSQFSQWAHERTQHGERPRAYWKRRRGTRPVIKAQAQAEQQLDMFYFTTSPGECPARSRPSAESGLGPETGTVGTSVPAASHRPRFDSIREWAESVFD